MTQLFGTVGQLGRGLNYHLDRHNVLASNVANIDTPGFAPLELVRQGSSPENPDALPLRLTHERHLPLDHQPEARDPEARAERVVQAGGDGNSVSLEREMGKIAANDLRYDGIATAVRQQMALLTYAANGGR